MVLRAGQIYVYKNYVRKKQYLLALIYIALDWKCVEKHHFPYIFCQGISDKDIVHTKVLVALIEKVDWRLIKVGSWDNKNYKRHT